MAKAVGIDLGTANSVIAVLEGGEPTVIANAEGSRTTPSVVAFARNAEVLVGEVAKRQTVTNADRTIPSVRRHMGTDWSVTIDGRKFDARQVSAFILRKLKMDAEAYLGEEITDAVITVPAYFGVPQPPVRRRHRCRSIWMDCSLDAKGSSRLSWRHRSPAAGSCRKPSGQFGR
jgi:molecular chaperone DnaK